MNATSLTTPPVARPLSAALLGLLLAGALLPDEAARTAAKKIIDEYVQPRVLTYRAKSL